MTRWCRPRLFTWHGAALLHRDRLRQEELMDCATVRQLRQLARHPRKGDESGRSTPAQSRSVRDVTASRVAVLFKTTTTRQDRAFGVHGPPPSAVSGHASEAHIWTTMRRPADYSSELVGHVPKLLTAARHRRHLVIQLRQPDRPCLVR